jgi:DNA gyrase inhibitor GyrI
MAAPEVRIVELPSMRVAAARGFGTNPEELAWGQLLAWAGERGLLEPGRSRRWFGFNSPDPSAGTPEYGYEQWMTVEARVSGEGGVSVQDVPARRYAVMRVEGLPTPAAWQRLVGTAEERGNATASGPWLEECLDPSLPPEQWTFDLYLPVEADSRG